MYQSRDVMKTHLLTVEYKQGHKMIIASVTLIMKKIIAMIPTPTAASN